MRNDETSEAKTDGDIIGQAGRGVVAIVDWQTKNRL